MSRQYYLWRIGLLFKIYIPLDSKMDVKILILMNELRKTIVVITVLVGIGTALFSCIYKISKATVKKFCN